MNHHRCLEGSWKVVSRTGQTAEIAQHDPERVLLRRAGQQDQSGHCSCRRHLNAPQVRTCMQHTD